MRALNEAISAATSPDTSLDVLERLSKHPVEIVRWHVAGNPSTGQDLLDRMSYDSSWVVRWKVADNPRAPMIALAQLITDIDSAVQVQSVRTIDRIGLIGLLGDDG